MCLNSSCHCPRPLCREVLAQLQALCTGHVAAVLYVGQAAAESFATASGSDTLDELLLATALPLVASTLPEAFVPGLLAPLDALMARPRQVRVHGSAVQQVVVLQAWADKGRRS